MPRNDPGYRKRWRTLAVLSSTLTAVGLVVECLSHMSSECTRVDPLKSPPIALLFVGMAAAPIVAEIALTPVNRTRVWLRRAALALIGLSLPGAAAVAVGYLPYVPLSLPLCMYCGMGALLWIPYLAATVLIAQTSALLRHWDADDRTSRPIVAVAVGATGVCAGAKWLVCLWNCWPIGPGGL